MYQHGALQRSPSTRSCASRSDPGCHERGPSAQDAASFVHGALVWSLVLMLGVPSALALLVVAPSELAIRDRAPCAPVGGAAGRRPTDRDRPRHASDIRWCGHRSEPPELDRRGCARVCPARRAGVRRGRHFARHFWSGSFLRRLGVEFVQRATHEEGAADTRRMIETTRRGETVVIFPEGHLSRVPGVRAFRLGAFLTAVEDRVPSSRSCWAGRGRCSRPVIAFHVGVQ